ncbi:uncharacterized protein LOC120419863 isoform X1 [Culex pipiens pallens]|uniref:uncharacterized protein LOC120419863 isoform X1 n=2 Tax=Culex pipiens pallens TaxID=42434 RepID=UPI0019544C2D|nr:uncharacterized protein LOC120419863 isoform X1 [Culex pipiens pallens]XP_039438648.1 uncharacterized protein LOC120419863 isoform X1 [Culex pipiens pallens]
MSMLGDMVQRSRTLYVTNNPPVVPTVMSLEESRRTQRPYRYGMILLCVGALVNWLGLAEDYAEPIRYTGVACILAGACLICTAMCCWLHTPNRAGSSAENDDPVHVISAAEERRCEKPPDYDSVAVAPPSYDDAIKLDPAALLHLSMSVSMPPPQSQSAETVAQPTTQATTPAPTTSRTFNFASILGRSSSQEASRAVPREEVASFGTENEKQQYLQEKPPPYDASAPVPASIVAAIPVQSPVSGSN